jgi:tetratricopeptide (TPR) repeat protein
MALGFKRGLMGVTLIALSLSLLGLAISAYTLYEARAVNDMVRHAKVDEIGNDAPPEALFAKAYELRRDGDLDAALDLYHRLEQLPDRDLSTKVSYNIGNIYVTRAQIEAQFARFKNIGILVGIARTQYQRALRAASDFYDAKYNLEYTRFLVTERDTEEQEYEGGLGYKEHNTKKDWAEFQEIPQGLP